MSMAARRRHASLVMLCRNRLPYTRQALESLEATRGSFEWVIVDNGSSDGTAEFLDHWAERARHDVHVLVNDHDPGGARARNQGVEAATGESVVFLDNDVVLDEPGWLEELLRPLSSGLCGLPPESIVASSPLLLFPGPDGVVQCAGGGITATGRFGLLRRGEADSPAARENRIEAWAPTATLLVRRSAFLQVGGFDESFDPVSLCEDLELCSRLRAHCGEIVFVGTSRLRHYEGTTFDHLGLDKRRYWRRHARVIKNRWLEVMTCGPLSSEDEVAWRPMVKEYAELERPRVRAATEQETKHQDLSFFAGESSGQAPIVRIGVIGCGQVARKGAFPGLSTPGTPQAAEAAPFLAFDGAAGVRLAGACDIDVSRALAAARRFGARHVERNAERLLDTVPLEGVVVCSPPETHSRLVIAALKRDVAVLVEKPVVVSHAELQKVLTARAAVPKVACVVNLPWVYHPAVEAVAALVRAGSLGPVSRASALMEHVGPEAWAPEATWYRAGGPGSVVLDLGLHVLAVLERVLGRPVARVGSSETDGGSDERARAIAMIGDLAARVEVGWDAPKPRFNVELTTAAGDLTLELVPWAPPSMRSVRVSCRDGWEGSPLDRDEWGQLWLQTPGPAIHGGPYRGFVEAIRRGSASPTDVSTVANAVARMLDWVAEAEEAASGTRRTAGSSAEVT